MRPHRKLDVWNKGINFVVNIYEVTQKFPRSEEYALSQQIRKAAISLPSNIAEGAARQTKKEFIQFLHIAQGSASEIDTQLEIALRLNYLTVDEKNKLDSELESIGKMLTGLIKSLK
jgi:four helix bundle protein